MLKGIDLRNNTPVGKLIAVISTVALSVTGVISLSTPAHASTPYAVFYNGNTIGTAVPASETQIRGSAFSLPPAASVTGSRAGYTFGGWALTAGGVSIANPYTYSSDANRVDLHAVWNTTVNYNTNGATSGSLASSKSNDVYRFGQTLSLPTAGTLARSGFAFGGWMASTVSASRVTTYSAGLDDFGGATLYAAWIKTVTFNANSAQTGTIPNAQIYLAGGERLRLPIFSEMTLRKPGYDFLGWASTATGTPVSNPTSFEPFVAEQTLYAIWKVQTTKISSRVFFKSGKSALRASQKLVLRDMVDKLKNKNSITLSLAATRPYGSPRSIGKARNTVVLDYLKAQGVSATVSRSVAIVEGVSGSAQKNNRVTIGAIWVNSTN